MRKTKENQKGITLVALVITIIILLILAGISISALTNTGIFQKAQEAKQKTEEAEANQKAMLDEYETELNKYTGSTVGLTASDISNATNKNEIYGKTVSYTPAGATTDVGWKIFYSDGTNIYLIADNYVEREALPSSTNNGVVTTNKLNNGDDSYGVRTAYFDNVLNDYTGSASITTTKLQNLNKSFFSLSEGLPSTNANMKVVSYMMDTTAWGGYKDAAGKAEYVIGGPTIEMIMNSYNQSYNVQYQAKAVNSYGYQVSKDNGTNWSAVYAEMLSTSDSLYVINSTENAQAMWVASSSANSDYDMVYVDYGGNVAYGGYGSTNRGFRPVICLNSNVILQESNGTYTIQ